MAKKKFFTEESLNALIEAIKDSDTTINNRITEENTAVINYVTQLDSDRKADIQDIKDNVANNYVSNTNFNTTIQNIITVEDIDTICGASIVSINEVKF